MAKPPTRTLQIGRTVRTPPATSPAGQRRAALRARVERAEAERSAQAEQARAEHAQKRAAQREAVKANAHYAAGQRGLSSVEATKLANATLAAFDRSEPGKFDLQRVIRDKLAAMGHGLRTTQSNPLDATLPPPPPEGNAPPPGSPGAQGDAAKRAEQAHRAQVRAAKLREQREADRQAYREALAKHGLIVPGSSGYPGSGGGTGLGM